MGHFLRTSNSNWILSTFVRLNSCFVKIICMVAKITNVCINPKEDFFSAMVLSMNKISLRYDFKWTSNPLHEKLNMFLILLEWCMKIVIFVIYTCWKSDRLVAFLNIFWIFAFPSLKRVLIASSIICIGHYVHYHIENVFTTCINI